MDKGKIVEKYGTDITKLNIGHVKKWVKALRSGKYRKIESELYTPEDEKGKEAFCALGVAAHLAGVEKELLDGEAELPVEAREWLGVDLGDPLIHGNYVSILNDGGKSFSHIAHLIEHFWIEPYEKLKHCFLKHESRSARKGK
jgi:hypothetical protein